MKSLNYITHKWVDTISFHYRKYQIYSQLIYIEIIAYDMGESFQDYSWIQDFEADFPAVIIASLAYFQSV